jgi:hypothetical protein
MSPPATGTLSPTHPPSDVSLPEEIVKAVNEGKCILFLGAMASAPSPTGCPFQYTQGPPGSAELSQRLAKKCDYPKDDPWNLARVSLYFATRKDKNRNSLIKAIAEEVAAKPLVSSPAMHMLAALPFPIIVTTNYDQLYDDALHKAKARNGVPKQPIIRIYDPKRNGPPDDVPLDIKEEQPVLLKLHGDIASFESIVVTEEDYITFIQRMSDIHLHPIHEFIRVRMKQWPILFIGYSLKDYNLRLLFRALRWNLAPEKFPLSYSVDPQPDDLIVSVWQDVGEKERIIYFVQRDLWDFVPALYKACTGKDYQPHE